MLSDKQITLFGRRWGACCAANDWRMARGRLAPEARLAGDALLDECVALAQQHAQKNSRALTVEDLRRGVAARVAGKFSSVKDFSNAQFDRLLALIGLLIDAGDLESSMRWQQFADADAARARGERVEDPGARRRLVASISAKAPEEYICHLARDLFHGQFKHPFWEDLPLPALYGLQAKVSARVEKWHAPAEPELALK